MTGHLGARVSALLDGQLSAQDTERAWDHVHACHFCRDQVEREGWVKTRLAGLSFDAGPGPAPDTLKGALLGMPQPWETSWETSWSAPPPRTRSTRRVAGLAAIGGGAAGAAVMGVLALGTAPADVPSFERRTPTQVSTPSPTPAPRLDNRLDPRLYTRMGR